MAFDVLLWASGMLLLLLLLLLLQYLLFIDAHFARAGPCSLQLLCCCPLSRILRLSLPPLSGRVPVVVVAADVVFQLHLEGRACWQ